MRLGVSNQDVSVLVNIKNFRIFVECLEFEIWEGIKKVLDFFFKVY